MKNRNIKKQMTPRQRCAILNPFVDGSDIHPRYHRRTGHIQTILTFDVIDVDEFEGPDKAKAEERSLDGWVGFWNARVTLFPSVKFDKWKPDQVRQARTAVQRLVARVGITEDVEITPGEGSDTIHVMKWATVDEVRTASGNVQKSLDIIAKRDGVSDAVSKEG